MTDDALRALLNSAFSNALSCCRDGAPWYVASPGGPRLLDFLTVMIDLDLFRENLVWVKDVFVFGRQDYHWRHETILYGWKPGAAHVWHGGRDRDTVLELARPRVSKEHPTMKPVGLVASHLQNSSQAGDVVLDPFAGSGSTLMACEQLGRAARAVELDPRYVDVICRRWQEHTGEKPVAESSGQPHDFTA